jgi:hypothetical protein
MGKDKYARFIFNDVDTFLYVYSLIGDIPPNLIKKYKDILNWEHIGSNPNILWTNDLFEEIKEEAFRFPNNFFADAQLPWTVEFIQKYKSRMNWSYMGINPSLTNNPDIIKVYQKELVEFANFDLIAYYKEQAACNNENNEIIKPTKQNNNFFENKEDYFKTVSDIENAIDVDWEILSQNEFLPWDENFIEQYKDKLNWENLCANSHIHWTDSMLNRFHDRINWESISNQRYVTLPVDFIVKYDNQLIWKNTTLYTNFCNYVLWDELSIETFKHKIDWSSFTLNYVMDWNIDIIIKYINYLDLEYIHNNHKLWDDVFAPLSEEDFDLFLGIIQVIKRKMILVKQQS